VYLILVLIGVGLLGHVQGLRTWNLHATSLHISASNSSSVSDLFWDFCFIQRYRKTKAWSALRDCQLSKGNKGQ
jgi:hypothetical protein